MRQLDLPGSGTFFMMPSATPMGKPVQYRDKNVGAAF